MQFVLRSLLFPQPILPLPTPHRFPLLPEGVLIAFGSFTTCDIYLHRLVLLRRLCSSFYSSFPSPSFPFYDDASLWLGQALLGPCVLFLFYMNRHTSYIVSLTLTYSILSRIYQGHCSLSWISLSPRRTIESTLPWNLRTPGVRLDARTPKERLLGQSRDQSSLRLYIPGPSVTDTSQTSRDTIFGHSNDVKFLFPLGPFSMNESFLIVPEAKRMDLPLFQPKKKICKQ